jgi:hypothetical protein
VEILMDKRYFVANRAGNPVGNVFYELEGDAILAGEHLAPCWVLEQVFMGGRWQPNRDIGWWSVNFNGQPEWRSL